MKRLVWALAGVIGLFLLVTEIYPAIHAWRVKVEFDAATAAAQRDQAQAQAGALTDHAPSYMQIQRELQNKPPGP
jgi:hypothetical protein